MSVINFCIYFVVGGLFTATIVMLQESGQRTLSGLATLMPTFTLVAYFLIGETHKGMAVSHHAKWVLLGSLVAWVPYMLVVAYFAPRIGVYKSILFGLFVFFTLALIYIPVAHHFKLFE